MKPDPVTRHRQWLTRAANVLRSGQAPGPADRPAEVYRLVRSECRDHDTTDAADLLGVTMFGNFARFGTFNEIDSFFEGRFLERVNKGAFAKTFTERNRPPVVTFNHGHDVHGRQSLGVPSVLREDDAGPFYEVPLLDTSYNRDLLPGLRQGAYGASYMFQVIREEWDDEPGVSDHNPAGIPERTIKEARLFEFGPVTFPADELATAGVRSCTDDVVGLFARNILGTPTPDTPPPGAPVDVGAADTPTPAPATNGHPEASETWRRAAAHRELVLRP